MIHDPSTADLPPLPPPERLQELLHDAARLGRDDMILPLLQAGAQLEARDAKGYTPLILASYNGRASTTALLLAEGADPGTPDGGRGNSALMGVAFKGYEPIAEMLVGAGADVNQRNHAGQTALMNATMFSHAGIVDLLLARGADVLAVDAAGNSAAGIAAAQNNAAMAAKIDAAVRGRGGSPRG